MGCSFHLFVTDLERAMYMLFQVTGDRRYRDFSVKEMGVKSWNLPIVLGRFPLLPCRNDQFLIRDFLRPVGLRLSSASPGEITRANPRYPPAAPESEPLPPFSALRAASWTSFDSSLSATAVSRLRTAASARALSASASIA